MLSLIILPGWLLEFRCQRIHGDVLRRLPVRIVANLITDSSALEDPANSTVAGSFATR